MINPQKVRTMSRKELFERNEGRMVLRLKQYCEEDPLWKGLARNAVCGIILYVIILLAVVSTMNDRVHELAENLGNGQIIMLVAGTMAITAAVYSLAADSVFRSIYRKKRSTLSRYRSDVLRLDRLEKELK